MVRSRLAGLLAFIGAVAIALAVASPTPAAAQETVTVPVGDTWFCDSSFQNGVCDTTINAGDTVVWNFDGATLPHTSTECGADCDSPTSAPLWDSGIIGGGGTFSFTFDEAGTYLYFCQVHPTLMRGRIIVQGDAAPPATETAPTAVEDLAPPSTATGPADNGTVAGPPTTGQGPTPSSGDFPWALAGLMAAGAVLLGAGFAVGARPTR